MTELRHIQDRLGWTHFFQGQLQHLLFALILAPGTLCLVMPFTTGQRVGPLTDRQAAALLITVVVAHQVTVWLVWRLQLCFGLLSRLLGKADLVVWGVVFFPFLGARVVLLAAVGIADYGSLSLPRWLEIGLGGLLLLLAAYTLYSVLRHFGLVRAMGGDHFRQRYLDMDLVREGIFRYSEDAMYTFGFAGLWALAFFLSSRAALTLALFQHGYIWVHLYCTERPDLAVLHEDR